MSIRSLVYLLTTAIVFDAALPYGSGQSGSNRKLFGGVGWGPGFYRLDQLNEAFFNVLYLKRIGHEVTSHDP
jgi:hypothetical protein